MQRTTERVSKFKCDHFHTPVIVAEGNVIRQLENVNAVAFHKNDLLLEGSQRLLRPARIPPAMASAVPAPIAA